MQQVLRHNNHGFCLAERSEGGARRQFALEAVQRLLPGMVVALPGQEAAPHRRRLKTDFVQELMNPRQQGPGIQRLPLRVAKRIGFDLRVGVNHKDPGALPPEKILHRGDAARPMGQHVCELDLRGGFEAVVNSRGHEQVLQRPRLDRLGVPQGFLVFALFQQQFDDHFGDVRPAGEEAGAAQAGPVGGKSLAENLRQRMGDEEVLQGHLPGGSVAPRLRGRVLRAEITQSQQPVNALRADERADPAVEGLGRIGALLAGLPIAEPERQLGSHFLRNGEDERPAG